MIKKLAIFAITMLTIPPAVAEKVVYTCQYNGSGGLKWHQYSWVISEMPNPNPGVFTITTNKENSIIATSIPNTSFEGPDDFKCHDSTVLFTQTCADFLGRVITFNRSLMEGAVASTLILSDEKGSEKLGPQVATFQCQKM
jgi:hypothetical protein